MRLSFFSWLLIAAGGFIAGMLVYGLLYRHAPPTGTVVFFATFATLWTYFYARWGVGWASALLRRVFRGGE